MEEGIVFERRSIATTLKKSILPVMVLLVVFAAFFVWTKINTGAHHAMQEARDVRVALRLVGMEYRSKGSSLYDPTEPGGMAKGAAQKIRELSYAEGEIQLTGWDERSGMPVSFTYRKGAYLVEYRALTGEGLTNGEWNIYYAFHVLTYSTEQEK